MKRRLNAYESGTASLGGLSDPPPEGVSMSSRASSVTSLEAIAGHRSSTDVPSPVTATAAASASSVGDTGSVNGNDVSITVLVRCIRSAETVDSRLYLLIGYYTKNYLEL